MQKFQEIFSEKFKNINYLIPLLIVVLYLVLFLRPKMQEFFRLLPEVSQLKKKIVNIEEKWQDKDAFNQRIARLYERLDYYEKSLPGEREIAALLKFLSDAAKEVNVRITEIKLNELDKDKKAKGSIYYQMPISLTAECSYHQLGRFLNRLESADRFMKISEIKIVANPQRVNQHFVWLSVITYVMHK